MSVGIEEASPALWQPDDSAVCCALCGAAFGIVVRRHHCRLCGNLFCARCSRASRALRSPGACSPTTVSSSSSSSSGNVSPVTSPGGARDHRVCSICAELTTHPHEFDLDPAVPLSAPPPRRRRAAKAASPARGAASKCPPSSAPSPASATPAPRSRNNSGSSACSSGAASAASPPSPRAPSPVSAGCPHGARFPCAPLPPPLILTVLSYLPISLYEDLMRVSKRFYNLIVQPLVWRRAVRTIFPNLGVLPGMEYPRDLAEASEACGCTCCGTPHRRVSGLGSGLDPPLAPLVAARSPPHSRGGGGGGGGSRSVSPARGAPLGAGGGGCGWEEQRNCHATCMQRQSPPGYFTLELPHYLRSAPTGATLKRCWGLPLEERLRVPDAGGGNPSVLAVIIPAGAVRNWRYFFHEKLLELAHRDLGYPLNTNLFTPRQVCLQVLRSLEARLRRLSARGGRGGGGGGGGGVCSEVHADPLSPAAKFTTPPMHPSDHEALSAGSPPSKEVQE